MCTNNLFRLVAKLRKHKHHTIRRLFTTNNHEYNCPYRSFANEHPDVARELVKVPQHYPTHNTILSKNEKLEDYLTWRGWDIKGILHRHELDNENMNSAAVGLLSHPLTFPLTLGRYISEMVSHDNTNYDVNGQEKKDIRICCVGARAEATLPDEYWRELLIAAFVESSITIDFIGPDIPSNLISSKTISLLDNHNNNEDVHIHQHNKSKLTMNYHKSYLHDVILKLLKSLHEQQKDTLQPSERTEKIRNIWDGYVLFNPGIGHPNLQKDWTPTLKFLIETSKPILFTSHSTIDADRDSKVLEKMLMNDNGNNCGRIVEYKTNPYASRMKFVDPFPTSPNSDDTSVHLVRPNDQIFLLNKR